MIYILNIGWNENMGFSWMLTDNDCDISSITVRIKRSCEVVSKEKLNKGDNDNYGRRVNYVWSHFVMSPFPNESEKNSASK